jgi:hypothetical protein
MALSNVKDTYFPEIPAEPQFLFETDDFRPYPQKRHKQAEIEVSPRKRSITCISRDFFKRVSGFYQ